MKTSDFDYYLPEDCIAQTPLEPRDTSRLLVFKRSTVALEHGIFNQIGKYLHPGDLLVLNQTRVIPARLYAHKPTGGRVELLLLRRRDELTWECLVGGKGLSVASKIRVEKGPHAEITEVLRGAERLVRFAKPIEPYFPDAGHVPLPPYIHTPLQDPDRYQTVYARTPGSAAAPTAGLHFTPRLLDELQGQGVRLAYVTLHVGLDTFAPVTVEQAEQHTIHTEWCQLSPETAEKINETRAAGGRVIAVGTTSVRTLESAGQGEQAHQRTTHDSRKTNNDALSQAVHNSSLVVHPYQGQTNLFILPGYQFNVVDAMITNFHLPRSTLLMLVSAFAGRTQVLGAYAAAVKEGYRFYSFGDAMLIL